MPPNLSRQCPLEINFRIGKLILRSKWMDSDLVAMNTCRTFLVALQRFKDFMDASETDV